MISNLNIIMFAKLKLMAVEWLMTTKFYKHVVLKVIPYVRFTTYYPTMNGKKFSKIYEVAEPGDIILTIDRKKLTTVLIPGEFSHAGMVVSKDGVWETAEMTHNHYDKTCLFDMAKSSDRIVIMRPTLPQSVINDAIEKCKSFEGADYDTSFSLGVEALYCSELIYESYENNSLGIDISDLLGMGKPYISPSGLYTAKNLEVVLDTDEL